MAGALYIGLDVVENVIVGISCTCEICGLFDIESRFGFYGTDFPEK